MNPSLDLLERGFTIFVLIFFTRTIACDSLYISPDPTTNGTPEDNPFSALLSLIQIIIYGLTTLLLLARWRGSIKTALQNKVIWALVGLVLISFLWSDFPDESLKKGINAFETSLFGLYMASRYSLKEQLRLIAWALCLVTVFSLLFTLAFPGAAIEIGANAGSWRGPLAQKNLLARLMVLATMTCSLAAFDSHKHRYLLCFGSVIALSLLFLSGSKTGLVVLLTLITLLPLYRSLRWKGTVVIPLVTMIILIIGSFAVIVVSNWEVLLSALGRDPSLSGRTELWQAALEKIFERPWLGYGFQGFWQDGGGAVTVWKTVKYKPPHAHNGYINTALDLGLLGLILFVISIINTYRKAITWLRLNHTFSGLLPILYATFLVMYNQPENTIIEHNSIFWSLFVAVSLSIKPLKNFKKYSIISAT
ncbi:O-antigen ligase [Calothrix sp. PCC 7507]|uniref:O-antigen ligase family protein n=1 Tax=Calothrix sp. PCC 7507 TaxID=99598 RepID=UPI00029F1062|nr:O-antigen ligase [Calothrix sp. PCC 7507]AFY32694.1 O-antigen polymerase [Calothrix sp. PCC 7507]